MLYAIKSELQKAHPPWGMIHGAGRGLAGREGGEPGSAIGAHKHRREARRAAIALTREYGRPVSGDELRDKAQTIGCVDTEVLFDRQLVDRPEATSFVADRFGGVRHIREVVDGISNELPKHLSVKLRARSGPPT